MLKNKKVYVGKFTKEIQEKAFEMGFYWQPNMIQNPLNANELFLFFYQDGRITRSSDLDTFQDHPFEEITPEEILGIDEEWIPKRGEKVKTEDGDLIYLATIDGAAYPYVVVSLNSESDFLSGDPFYISLVESISPIPQKTIVTLEEIAKWKGVKTEQIEIKYL